MDSRLMCLDEVSLLDYRQFRLTVIVKVELLVSKPHRRGPFLKQKFKDIYPSKSNYSGAHQNGCLGNRGMELLVDGILGKTYMWLTLWCSKFTVGSPWHELRTRCIPRCRSLGPKVFESLSQGTFWESRQTSSCQGLPGRGSGRPGVFEEAV